MATPTIISAVVITYPYPKARLCIQCLRPILFRALRVCEKDEYGVAVYYYHDQIDDTEDVRGCAPDNGRTRAALAPRRAVV
jgi:hypothetical protein